MTKKGTSLTFMVMKPFVLLLLPFLIILNIMPSPNGRPILTWYQDSAAWFAGIKQPNSTDISLPFSQPQPESVELYRWQDDKGRWHFSQEKPANNEKVETLAVSTTLSNIMPKPKDIQTTTDDSSANAITPFNVLEKAKALKKTSENRNRALNSL